MTTATRAKASPLASVTKGKHELPPRILLYGQEGVGKSTFGAGAPNAIFVPTEDGLDQIEAAKFPLANTFGDVMEYLTALANDEHDYGAVVVDSLDWLERLIWDHLCREHQCESIELVAGGYGKGYTFALKQWRELIAALNYLRMERGMVVVMIAHAEIKAFADPEAAAYDRWQPRLHKSAVSIVCEWCDAVLFAGFRYRTKTEKSGFGKERTTAHAIGTDGGQRIIRPVGGPACLAKNRYCLTKDIDLDWSAFVKAIEGVKSATTDAA
jgi:hypothetical protein